MIFGKKDNKKVKCENCGKSSKENYSFCPSCGNNLVDLGREKEDFGLLGRDDFEESDDYLPQQGFGLTDKLISSLFNSVMKNLDKQFREIEKDSGRTEVNNLPNGIRIKIMGPFAGQPEQMVQKRKTVGPEIDESKLKKLNSMPRGEAKTNVKRLGDKLIYELSVPGIDSPKDVFVSKTESGYEIKAIGQRKVYINSVPINLPLRGYSILKNKLLVEFLAG